MPLSENESGTDFLHSANHSNHPPDSLDSEFHKIVLADFQIPLDKCVNAVYTV